MKNRYLLAVVASLVMALGYAAPAHAYGKNGVICTSVKGNTTANGYDAEMDSGRGVLDLFLTPAPGYCTDYYHPSYFIYNLRINPWTQCTSQYGYVYRSNKGLGKDYGWTGTQATKLVLTCVKVSINGSW